MLVASRINRPAGFRTASSSSHTAPSVRPIARMASPAAAASLYDLNAKDIEGNDFSFSELKGKVALITNVACYCGYTNGNYKELVALYDKYKDQGLEVLAFPCNQFGAQEPGSPAQIKDFVKKYGVAFKMMEKVDVNGPNTHPVWSYLKSACDTCGGDVTWNFKCKFIIDKNGQVVERNGNNPSASEGLIQRLLSADMEH